MGMSLLCSCNKYQLADFFLEIIVFSVKAPEIHGQIWPKWFVNQIPLTLGFRIPGLRNADLPL